MKLRLSIVAGLVCCAALAAGAAVVRRVDETSLQGEVVGLEKGNVIVSARAADGSEQRAEVPLEDVVEINFDPAATAPAPATQAQGVAQAAPSGPAPGTSRKGVSARFYNAQFWKGSDPRVIGGEVTIIGEPDVSTTVPSLNNTWDDGSPDPRIPNERFSTIYFGKVRSGAAGAYSFLGFSDDDHYLYVNGKLVSVDTGAHGPRDPRGGSDAAKVSTIELAANSEYDLLYLQNENIGGAAATVMWIPPGGQAPEAIPEENLSTATGVPAAPSGFAADASAGNEVKLTFRDVSTSEIRYTLERAGDAAFSSQKVVNYLPINATTYTDSTVAKGGTYFYRLTAVNFEGQSPPVAVQVTAGQQAGAPVAAAAVPAAAQLPAAPRADAEGFVPIFDGKDLSGWKGIKEQWRVEDGAITASVPEGQEREGSDYLVWEGASTQDFELRLKFKAVGMNSGIQFRSRVTDEASFQVAGYQADIEDYRPITGTIWDQGGTRGTVGPLGQKVTHEENSAEAEALNTTAEQVLESVKSGEWNDMTITAIGNTLTVKVNGLESTVAVDNHPAAEKAGVVAIQLDHYRPGSIQFKDIRLKTLGTQPQPAAPVAAAPAQSAPNPPAVTQSAGERWSLELAGGDRLSGAVRRWTDKEVVIAADAGEVTVPVRRVRQAWRGDEAAAKAKSMVQAGAEDTAFVLADNNDVRPVRGIVLGVEGNSLNFRFDERDRKIALDRLVGVTLGETDAAAPNNAFHQSILLASGDSLSGAWVGLAAGVLELRTPWDAKLSIPVEKVSAVKCRNGRLLYLSDLAPAAVQQVPYFDRMLPFQVDRSLTGGKLKLSDGEHDKGIAVHSRTVLRYDTGGEFSRLKGKVGFQDPEGKLGNAAVRIVGDGKTLFDRPEARGDQPAEEFDLDVSGVKALSLEVDFGRGQDVGDRVVWANPRLLRADVKKR